MSAPLKWFGNGLLNLAKGNIDLDSDSFKLMLCPSTYTPDQDAHDFRNDVTEISTVATTLSSAAAAAATTVSVAAAIPVGTQIAIDTAGTVEVRTVTAVTGAGPYTLTLSAALSSAHASGAAVQASPGYTAGGVALTGVSVTYDAASNQVRISWADPSWTGSITGRTIVIYKVRGGASSADELLAYGVNDVDVSSSGAAFTVDLPSPTLTLTAA
jgi:hypothetical protein